MKDYIKRLFVLCFFWIFVWFLFYNLLIGQSIVQMSHQEFNYPVYAILIALSLYVVWCYGLVPTHVKFSRAILFEILLVFFEWLLWLLVLQVWFLVRKLKKKRRKKIWKLLRFSLVFLCFLCKKSEKNWFCIKMFWFFLGFYYTEKVK